MSINIEKCENHSPTFNSILTTQASGPHVTAKFAMYQYTMKTAALPAALLR